MKNILICQHGGSGNHGCEALARTAAALLRQAEPNCRITLYTYHLPEDRAALADLGVELCGLRTPPGRFSPYNFHYHLSRRLGRATPKLPLTAEFRALVEQSDLVVAIGGDNYCYKMGQGYYPLDRYIRSRGKKYVLLGCSVEPEDLPRGLARHLSLFDCITVRERISYDAMLKAGLDDLVLAPDSAFLLPPEQPDELPAGFEPERAVGLNFSPMVIANEKTPGMTLENFKQLALYLLKRTDLQLALIPHVVWRDNDDRRALEQLWGELSGYAGRVFLIPDMGARALKEVISRLQFFVGARTHATIAAYSSGVPTLTLGYSVKARGIAADLFGTEEGYVLPVQDLKEPEQLLRAFKPLFARRDELRQTLQARLPAYLAGEEAVVDALRALLARPETEAYAVFAQDARVREAGSSGGLFGLLGLRTIARGGRVVAAGFDGELRLRHAAADTPEQLWPLCGSKYLLSDFAPAISLLREALEQGREALFCGTPCQAAAVRAAFGEQPGLSILEVICHGTPVPEAFAGWKSELERRYGARMRSYSFRDKRLGWKRFSSAATFENGAEYTAPLDQDPYMQLFLHDLILRPSCYICRNKRSSAADLTIGDFWGLRAYLPALDDDRGVTLAVVRTARGGQLLAELEGVHREAVTLVGMERHNPCLFHPVARPTVRDEVCARLSDTPVSELARQYIASPSAMTRLKGCIKRLLGR